MRSAGAEGEPPAAPARAAPPAISGTFALLATWPTLRAVPSRFRRPSLPALLDLVQHGLRFARRRLAFRFRFARRAFRRLRVAFRFARALRFRFAFAADFGFAFFDRVFVCLAISISSSGSLPVRSVPARRSSALASSARSSSRSASTFARFAFSSAIAASVRRSSARSRWCGRRRAGPRPGPGRAHAPAVLAARRHQHRDHDQHDDDDHDDASVDISPPSLLCPPLKHTDRYRDERLPPARRGNAERRIADHSPWLALARVRQCDSARYAAFAVL